MTLPVTPPVVPMLSRQKEQVPRGEGWLYEPKWDGFRAIGFIDGGHVHIGSRRQRPLERYFPEVVEALRDCFPSRCVVDGEIVIASERGLDFEALQLRLHPAASRVKLLAAQTPASFVAFDLLALADDDLRAERFDARRARLEESIGAGPRCFLTPQTADTAQAEDWFERYEGAGLDGVVAKRAEGRYAEGERVMVKVKHERTTDCVVIGYRPAKGSAGVGSLLLGLYDETGKLHYVGHTSSFKAAERRELLGSLAPLRGGNHFEGEWGPGGQSRWNAGRDPVEWVSLEPVLVCEVAFDHMQGLRFRHASRFLRWRTDKDPGECTFEQLIPPRPFSLDDVVR